MQRTFKEIALALAAPAFAALVVFCLEAPASAWLRGREAVLPVTLCVLLAALFHARTRQMLVVSLCYGVSFLALKDIISPTPMRFPPELDYVWTDIARNLALTFVSMLAASAALVETWKPGTVWARRCYFLAAALYFSGSGFLYYLRNPSWKSLLLCVTGIIALAGVLYAQNIVASEREELAEEDDIAEQQARDLAHRQMLRAREWHDSDTPEPASARKVAPSRMEATSALVATKSARPSDMSVPA